MPSPHESLSLLALEAMAVGTPVLVNGRSDVLVDHCRKSNAGLYYTIRDEFIEALKMLLADERLRAQMGRNGKEYIEAELPLGRDHGEIRSPDRRVQAAMTKRPAAHCRRPRLSIVSI